MSSQVNENQSGRSAPLAPGTQAPAFTLPVTPDQNASLADFRGRPVILAFYPADWSPVCGDQMGLYNEVLPEFKRFGAELLASRSMVPGVTALSDNTVIYIFRCFLTSSLKGKWQRIMECIDTAKASASARFS